jgi:hypothetical protein
MTKNVMRFHAGMEAVDGSQSGRIGNVLVEGDFGTGKTECAQKYAADNVVPYIRATDIMTRRSLLSAIVGELGEAPRFRTDDLFGQALDQLLERPRPLIVDEVEYLIKDGMVEVLRDINDITNCPVVMIGMHQISKKLQRFRHLFDRFSAVVRFAPFDLDDIRSLTRQICEVPVDDAGVQFIFEQGQGRFRKTTDWFKEAEKLAKVNGLEVVTAQHLRAKGGGR